MKKLIILFTITILAFGFKSSNKVNFHEDGWSAAVKDAKQTDKPLFVFARTATCMTSARMDNVFKDPKVAAFFNANFVCVQLFTESPMDNLRTSNWGLTAVPTFFFFTNKKDKIASFQGFRDADAVIAEATKALKMMGVKDIKGGTIEKSDGKGKKSDKDDDDDDDKE